MINLKMKMNRFRPSENQKARIEDDNPPINLQSSVQIIVILRELLLNLSQSIQKYQMTDAIYIYFSIKSSQSRETTSIVEVQLKKKFSHILDNLKYILNLDSTSDQSPLFITIYQCNGIKKDMTNDQKIGEIVIDLRQNNLNEILIRALLKSIKGSKLFCQSEYFCPFDTSVNHRESYRSLIKRVGIKFICFQYDNQSEKYTCQDIVSDLLKEPNFDFYDEGKSIFEQLEDLRQSFRIPKSSFEAFVKLTNAEENLNLQFFSNVCEFQLDKQHFYLIDSALYEQLIKAFLNEDEENSGYLPLDICGELILGFSDHIKNWQQNQLEQYLKRPQIDRKARSNNYVNLIDYYLFLIKLKSTYWAGGVPTQKIPVSSNFAIEIQRGENFHLLTSGPIPKTLIQINFNQEVQRTSIFINEKNPTVKFWIYPNFSKDKNETMAFEILKYSYQDESEVIGQAFLTQQELNKKFEKKEFEIKLQIYGKQENQPKLNLQSYLYLYLHKLDPTHNEDEAMWENQGILKFPQIQIIDLYKNFQKTMQEVDPEYAIKQKPIIQDKQKLDNVLRILQK